MFESSLQRPRARVLLTQGKAPQDLNGLLLVHPEDSDVFVPWWRNDADSHAHLKGVLHHLRSLSSREGDGVQQRGRRQSLGGAPRALPSI